MAKNISEKENIFPLNSYPKFTFPNSSVMSSSFYPFLNSKNINFNKEPNSKELTIREFGDMEIEEDIKQFTKNDYLKIVRKRRKEFIHTHFGKILSELFDHLKSEANKMRNCHHEVTFECPSCLDVDKTEYVLREYFKDIGFETIATPRKDDSPEIILTIT